MFRQSPTSGKAWNGVHYSPVGSFIMHHDDPVHTCTLLHRNTPRMHLLLSALLSLPVASFEVGPTVPSGWWSGRWLVSAILILTPAPLWHMACLECRMGVLSRLYGMSH